MKTKNEVPILRGEALYIPFVGAIIERLDKENRKQVVIQIRKKESDLTYNGSIEIPGGKLKAFEDIYDAVRREVHEECGLKISFIRDEEFRKDFANREDVSSLIEPFCVTQMKNGPFIGMIFLCRAEGKLAHNTKESREAKWIDIVDLKDIVEKTPEKIYTAFLAPLKKYLHFHEV